jgi:acyl transferase domain-containing protein
LQEHDISDQNNYKDKITILADIYVKGYNLDWSQLLQKGRYFRVPLPTYPFTRESYWVAETPRDRSQNLLKNYTGALPDTTSNTEGRTEAVGIVPCADAVPTALFPFLQPLREALSRMVSNLLKVRVEEIDAKTPLSEYGFDSITFTELANRLNQSYQLNLTSALFFEYSTLSRLAQYLYATYASVLTPYFVGTGLAPVRESVAHLLPSCPSPTTPRACGQGL